jgi:hypothetical protein
MEEVTKFKQYAEECRRLAKAMPEHEAALLEIAQAWDVCASNLSRQETKPETLN